MAAAAYSLVPLIFGKIRQQGGWGSWRKNEGKRGKGLKQTAATPYPAPYMNFELVGLSSFPPIFPFSLV